MDMRGGIMTQGVTIADKDTYGASNYQTGIYAPSAVTGGSIQTSLTGSPDKFNQNFSIQMAPGSTTTIGTNAPYSSETALTITKSSTSNPLVAITQSNSTWNNNPALYITGVLTANGTIYCLKSSSTAVPGLGILGGLGDRLVLSQGSATVYPFSMGVTGISQWYSIPTGATHNFYINGINNTTISSSGLTTANITTPQLLSTTTNNISCISCTVLPSGTGTSGYWYIDVTNYVANQKGSIILCNISLNSASYLWTGRIVVQAYSTPAVKLYPDYVTGNLVIATSYHISGIILSCKLM